MTGTGIANNKYLWEGLEKAAVQKNSLIQLYHV